MTNETENEPKTVCSNCGWQDGHSSDCLQQVSIIPKACIVVTGCVKDNKAIYFVSNQNPDARQMITDGKILAEYCYQNLPAVTFTVFLRECLMRASL